MSPIGYTDNKDVDQDTEQSTLEEEMQEDKNTGSTAGLECSQVPIKVDQMAEKQCGVCVAQKLACSLCKQLFSSMLQLRKHEYDHALSFMSLSLNCLVQRHPSARYQCPLCPASFTLKSNADRHEKTVHQKRKLLQCTYCLKHFRDRTDLNRHLASMHSVMHSECGYTCPVCAHAFATPNKLETHIKIGCRTDVYSTKSLGNS